MTSRLVVSLALAAVATTALADPSKTPKLVSCVGGEYVALQRTTWEPNNPADHESCLSDGDLTVCRRLLGKESSTDDTMAVSIRASGIVVQSWLEKGDPGYLDKIYAFKGLKDKSLAVVATQQSETQGMGAQEWDVNVVSIDGRSPSERRTFTTAEFGRLGTLVRNNSAAGSSCHLLSTHWETRATSQGDRLFLVGQLLELQGGTPPERAKTSFSRRFDHRLERQREAQPEDRPLVYFKRQR